MTDKEILNLYFNESSRNVGFSMLLEKYQERTYWHIRKMLIIHEDADDVCQEVFIKVFKKLNTFQESSNLFTWIYRIATNESLNFLRKKKTKFFLPIVDYENKLISKISNSDLIDGDKVELELQKAILTLPEKQRVVFNLKYFEELDYKQISEITGTSVGGLKASYHHAVNKIKNQISTE